MKQFQSLGRSLSKEEQKRINGGMAQPVPGGCGVKINGEWRAITPDDNGLTKPTALRYVENGWATNWCCDSCPWNAS